MIDFLRAKQAFGQYVGQYNPEDTMMKLKIRHTMRTVEIAEKLASSLDLEQEEIQLAKLIALLHDIGRFEQIRTYHTFVDKNSINHAAFGADLLFKERLIRNFILEDTYDTIIETAIRNHNCGEIQTGLEGKTKLHCQIIRDSDKLDILYLLPLEDPRATYGMNIQNQEIAEDIYQDFMQNPDHKINYQNIRSGADLFVAHMAFVFDLNFTFSLQKVKEEKLMDKILQYTNFQREDTKEKVKQIYQIVQKQIKEKCE